MLTIVPKKGQLFYPSKYYGWDIIDSKMSEAEVHQIQSDFQFESPTEKPKQMKCLEGGRGALESLSLTKFFP